MKNFIKNYPLFCYIILFILLFILIFIPDFYISICTEDKPQWNNTFKSLCFTIYTGLLVTAVLSFYRWANDKYLKGGELQTLITRVDKLKKDSCIPKCIDLTLNCQKLSEWGLEEITEGRRTFKGDEEKFFINAKKCVDIIAFGLSFSTERNDPELVAENIKNFNLKIRIICPDPKSDTAKKQEFFETPKSRLVRFTEWNKTQVSITALIKWVASIKDNLDDKFKNNITLLKYDNLPLFFYMKIDDKLYVGPYMLGKYSKESITFHFKEGEKGFKYFSKYFDDVLDILQSNEYIDKKKEYKKINKDK